VYKQYRSGSPASAIERTRKYLNVAHSHNLQLDYFQSQLREQERYLGESERQAVRQREMENMFRNREPDVLPEPGPGEIRLNVSLNSEIGNAYGSIPINISTEAPLSDAIELVRQNLRRHNLEEIVLPEPPARIIFAGRLYQPNTIIRSINNLRSGVSIHFVF